MQRAWRVVVFGLLTAAGCSKISGIFGSRSENANPVRTTAPKGPAPSKARLDNPSTARTPGTDHGAAAPRPSKGDAAAEKAWTPPPVHARGAIFGRLPKGTLFAARIPDVSLLGEAFRRSALPSLLDSPFLATGRAQFEQGMKQAKAELLARVSDFDALMAEAQQLKGELVVAVPMVDLMSLAGGAALANGPTFTVAMIYQAGASADSFQHLFDRAVEVSKEKDGQGGLDAALPIVASGTNTWMRRHRDDRSCVTLARDGDRFTLTVTNAPSALAANESLAELPLDDSFNAADLVRATPDAATEGGRPVAEVFLNLAPIWSAVALAVPPEAKEPLANSGLTSVGGISLSAALGKKGLDESLLLLSPGGRDILSRFCTGKPLGTALASWLPGDAADSSLCSLDFAGLFDSIRGMVPLAARKSFDDGLTQMRQQTGIDLRNDLFANIGPNFGFASHGSVEDFIAGHDFEWICAIELQDATRMRRVFDKFLKQSGLAATIKNETIEGFAAYSTDLPPMTTPLGQSLHLEPAWLIDEHALIIATKPSALAKAVRALKARGAPTALRAALTSAGADAFGVAVRGTTQDAITTVGRRTPAGLVVATRDGNGAMATGAVAWGASVAAALALPQLLKSRINSNEGAAVESLRAIWTAETTLRSSQGIDVDSDARGEFGTLAELSGAVPLRGRAAPAPCLDATYAPDASGVLQRGGYMFRVYLPTKAGSGAATLDPAAPSPVATDLAEQQFLAYAWPVDPPTTGTRVFVVDASGAIFFTTNESDLQHYSAARVPPFEAAQLRDPSDRVKGVTAVRRGRDGGIWLEQH